MGNTTKIVIICFECLVFVLGVLGNGLVIWVTGFKMKKTVNTVFFLNLAVADFLFTASLPLTVTQQALDFHWPFGKIMCKLNSIITSLNIYASVYILVVISVDRCVSVVFPVWAQNQRNVRKASYVSLGVWMLALILSAPNLVFKDTITMPQSNTSEEITECFNNYLLTDEQNEDLYELEKMRFQVMYITQTLMGFVVPFIVIVFCYTVIIHRLRRNSTLARKSKRSVKIIVVVIIAFFFCWAPYHILNLIELVNYSEESDMFIHILTIGIPITSCLAFMNSCINPLLYVFMGQDFRTRLCLSITSVLEAALKEDVSRSYSITTTMKINQRKESSLTTDV